MINCASLVIIGMVIVVVIVLSVNRPLMYSSNVLILTLNILNVCGSNDSVVEIMIPMIEKNTLLSHIGANT